MHGLQQWNRFSPTLSSAGTHLSVDCALMLEEVHLLRKRLTIQPDRGFVTDTISRINL